MESVASSIGSSAPTGSSARSSPAGSPSLKITSGIGGSQSNSSLSAAAAAAAAGSLTGPYDSTSAAAAAAAHSRLIAGYPRLSSFYSNTTYPPPPPTTSTTSTGSDGQTSLYSTNPATSFYPSLGTPYDLDKSAGNTWTGLSGQTTPASTYPTYDPSAHSFYTPYGNCYGAIDSAARRKNATRETTNTLKAWLYEHRKNPYPTKGEKIMLAIITKMTLTQVSTWFANARRRLKKENKMTWEPKNKATESRDNDDKDSCKSLDDDDDDTIDVKPSIIDSTRANMGRHGGLLNKDETGNNNVNKKLTHLGHLDLTNGQLSHQQTQHNVNQAPQQQQQAQQQHSHSLQIPSQTHHHFSGFGHPHDSLDSLDGQRPKIWSLAQTATADAAAAASLAAGRFYPDWYTSTFPGSAPAAPQELLGSFTDTYSASHPHSHHHHHHHHNHHLSAGPPSSTHPIQSTQQPYTPGPMTQTSGTPTLSHSLGQQPPHSQHLHSVQGATVQPSHGAGSFYKAPAWQSPETSSHVRAAAAAAAAVASFPLNSNSLKIHV